MTKEELAAKLSGREYTEEMTATEAKEAKDARLFVVFGASDDLTEFRGVLYDEEGAYEGSEHKIIRDGGKWTIANIEGEECKKCRARMEAEPGISIKAEWCPDDLKCSWRISTPVPHATFDIMEDGELYCRGIVIAETDMLAALGSPASDPA